MLDERSKHLRRLAIRCLRGGNRGHVGSTMSLIEIMRVLYDEVARHDPKDPKDPARDRIILSKGHGCIAQYVILADHGYFPIEELDRFCRKDGILGGHPSAEKVPGIECDTGALGHGLAIGVGMALAAKMKGEKHRVFVVMGDGECNEGSVWEAALLASKHKLDNLIVIIDYNKIQSAGFVADICPLEPLKKKWQSFGWFVYECDGHDTDDIISCLGPYPTRAVRCIIAHTIKGRGISFAENEPMWHHKAQFDEETFQRMEAELD